MSSESEARYLSEIQCVDSRHLDADIAAYAAAHEPMWDPVKIDFQHYLSRQKAERPRLMEDYTDIPFITVYYSGGVCTRLASGRIKGAGDLDKLIGEGLGNKHTFLSIRPRFSFGKLQVSDSMFWKILGAFSIFPNVLDVVHLFGQKIDEINEDFAVFHQEITRSLVDDSIIAFELCYNFRYVEQREGNMTPDKIWTTRKLGLSARFSPTDKSTNWLLFYPESTSGFSRRLEEVFKSDAKRKAPRRHDLEVHLLLMRTANQNWTPHLNDLDKEFRVMDARVFLWRPQKQKSIANAHQGPGLEMEDTQRIQMFKVKLLHVSHSLEINCANIASLRRALELFKIEGENQYANECQYQKYDRALKELHFQTTQHIIRVKNLIRCTDGLFALVCTIIPYVFARRENSLMLKLSEKAAQYARSMKVITVLCMAYLPPSLIAGVFGMDIVSSADTRSSTGIWFLYFLLATLGLLALTMFAWLGWERRYRKQHMDRQDATIVDLEKAEF